MAKIRIVAREVIYNSNGVLHNDDGLKALDGYKELIVDIPAWGNRGDAIKLINEKFPDHRFEEYDFTKIE